MTIPIHTPALKMPATARQPSELITANSTNSRLERDIVWTFISASNSLDAGAVAGISVSTRILKCILQTPERETSSIGVARARGRVLTGAYRDGHLGAGSPHCPLRQARRNHRPTCGIGRPARNRRSPERWRTRHSDLRQASSVGFSTFGSLGLGLPGTKRLMDEFEIASRDRRRHNGNEEVDNGSDLLE